MRAPRDGKLELVELRLTTIPGEQKLIEVSAENYRNSRAWGKGADGSSLGFLRVEDSDLILRPVPDTFFVAPWDGRVGSVVCDLYRPGDPDAGGSMVELETSPRGVLKRAVAELGRRGLRLMASAEIEFFLLKPDGTLADRERYFAPPPSDANAQVRRSMVRALVEIGVPVDYSHHEVSRSQYEVTLRLDDALAMADKVQTAKHVMANVAASQGLIATFMPKPFTGMNGSGMHIHFSLWRGRRNLFSGPGGWISELAGRFIAGVLRHAKALSALLSPTVNSYKRLVPGFEAPVRIGWGRRNRSAFIRIPAALGRQSVRVELRSPDPLANPYLALAGIIHAGLEGVEEGLEPPPEVRGEAYHLEGLDTLPATIEEALQHLGGDATLRRGLGPVVDEYIRQVGVRWREYIRVNGGWDPTAITQWELDEYLKRT